MKKTFKLFAFISLTVLMSLSFLSCAPKPIDQTKLDGYWVLTELNGQEATDVFKGVTPFMEFNSADTMISGNAGCNRFFGKYKINEKNQFSAPKLGSTLMMCMDDNKEFDFLKALGDTTTIGFDQSGKLAFVKDKKVVLVFEQGEAPVQAVAVTIESLVGKWILKSIGTEDLSSMFGEKLPFIEFNNEGIAVGNSGCNNFRTQTTFDAGAITFGPIMGTKMACPNLSGEALFTSLLTGQFTSKIADNVLTLSKEGKVVLEFSKE